MQETTPSFLSTAEAAQMLGISTTLVQTLVDKQELAGWRTRGGHRRIALESVRHYQAQTHSGRHLARPRAPEVVVVSEHPDCFNSLQNQHQRWSDGLSVHLRDSVSSTLLELSGQRPDVLVVELSMPRPQQEKTVLALQTFAARGPAMSITLLTQEPDLQPPETAAIARLQLVHGALSSPWLEGFLAGVRASKALG
mgnify:CR=1 FL=1